MNESVKVQTAMIIDDDEVDQMLYGRVIKRSGIIENVLSFFYADEALEFLKQPDREEIDVIFLDINMPRMSGLEFLKCATEELGEDFAKLVVIMLTTSLDPGDRERALSYEFVKAFFNKPLTIDQLREVASILEQKRSAKQVTVASP